MMSRRNYAMMVMMVIVVLVLFLSSPVLKEFFNDYEINHAAETELINRKEQEAGESTGSISLTGQKVLFIGTRDNGYLNAVKEWAGYRKKSFQAVVSLEEAAKQLKASEKQTAYLLIDGKLIEENAEETVENLSRYAEEGHVLIFYRLPSWQVIKDCEILQDLLGIQYVRAESVNLHEIRLYSGFLLGGETCYSFEGVQEAELVDIDREVPWYDISSGTKSYMVGFLSSEEKVSMNLNNEDMPAIIWRNTVGTGSVFAVNGDYMKGETALGLLDAMIYESEDYVLYPVVNAQNLSITGFPDLTDENEDKMQEVYGMTTQQLCRDIIWPSLVSCAEKDSWKITAFLTVKQSTQPSNEPNQDDLINYLKYFNEVSAEAGIGLGRIDSWDIRMAVADEREILKNQVPDYVFSGGYVRKENKEEILSLIDRNGQMEFFQDIRTIVGEFDQEQKILSWMTDKITLQNATTNAYTLSYQDSLRLKSLETALGYSNIQADIYRVLWPENKKDEWETIAERMASNIDTYWKPFAAFDKTTITESDSRVRNFLNGSVKSVRNGKEILIQTEDFTGDAYLLLRTHGEMPEKMTGGNWKEVERNTWLLQITSKNASITLRPELEMYYKE